jgi:hypothetical protein
MTSFIFETYAAVWRMQDDDLNAVVYLPVEVRSAPDAEGNVRCFMRRDRMIGAALWRVIDNYIILPLGDLVLDLI